MSIANPAIGATQFAMYMAATNLTYSWTSPYGGRIADADGYAAMFLVAAAIQVCAIAVLPIASPKGAREHYAAIGAASGSHAPAG
jgi:predicted MFS family arabinose efflux permease